MLPEIKPYDEFLALPEPEQKESLESYRNVYTNRDIRRAWKITDGTLYKHINHLGLEKKMTKRKKTSRKNNKDLPTLADLQKEKQTEAAPVSKIQSPELQEVLDEIKKTQPVKEDGFQFSFNGQYDAADIIKKLEKLQLLLDDEESQFDIQFTVKELCK